MPLATLGLTTAIRSELEGRVPDGFELARVTAVNRNDLAIETESGPVLAEVTGRLRHMADSELDLPAVGDWVAAQIVDEDRFAIVTEVLPRATVLKRRHPGRRTEYQLIAANVDVAFIVHPADQPVHARRLERYLVVARDGGVEPVIVLSKTDLIAAEELDRQLEAARALAEAVPVSSLSEDGLAVIRARLEPGRTCVLLGPSGVGKSTLLNGLIGSDVFATREIREGDRKGRHTTTRRELVVLDDGAIFIDTPGMRELGIADAQEGLDDTFADIVTLAEDCRYRDCTHTEEAGCAVREAVETGSLDEGRYQSFLRLEREAAHYGRSYLEQRRRDKEFGRMVREVMKHKKDRR